MSVCEQKYDIKFLDAPFICIKIMCWGPLYTLLSGFQLILVYFIFILLYNIFVYVCFMYATSAQYALFM